eukprot:m.118399 g.118399  ORF g.118399 m.118399 type:complete len:231 (-) comp17205_c0_seq10:269-961(-)
MFLRCIVLATVVAHGACNTILNHSPATDAYTTKSSNTGDIVEEGGKTTAAGKLIEASLNPSETTKFVAMKEISEGGSEEDAEFEKAQNTDVRINSIPCPNGFRVEGAGTEDVNGIYTPRLIPSTLLIKYRRAHTVRNSQGSDAKKVAYTKDGTNWLYTMCGTLFCTWRIGDVQNHVAYYAYESTPIGASPPTTRTGWFPASATHGTPPSTVTCRNATTPSIPVTATGTTG